MSSVHAPEPPIDNTPIFGDAPYTSGASFSCDAAQYAAFQSFYAALGGAGPGPTPPPPPPVLSGVLSVNTATGVVVIDGANGVAVSSGTPPTVSLGDITPTSLTASGTITAAGALTGASGDFSSSLTTGPITCATDLNVVNNAIVTAGGISAAGITIANSASCASATVSGLTSVLSLAIPGAFNLASLLNGSLSTPAPTPIIYGTTTQYNMVIAGWTIKWGSTLPSLAAPNEFSTFEVNYASPFVGTPAVGIFNVRAGGGGEPFLNNATSPDISQAPNASGFEMRCDANTLTPQNRDNSLLSWIAIGF